MARKLISNKGIIILGILIFSFSSFQLRYDSLRDSKVTTSIISFVVHEGTELAFDISPDGKTIVFDLLGQIWLFPSEGGEARSITNSIEENTEQLYPVFTENGKKIIFWESRPSSWGLTLMDLTSGERRILTELSSSEDDSYNDRFFACSPIRSEIAFIRNGKLMSINYEKEGTPIELNIEDLSQPGITDPAYTPDGSMIAFINARADYTSHSGSKLCQMLAKGGQAQYLTPETNKIRAPCYSPDGRSIAFFVLNNDQNFEIWVQNIDGKETRKIAGQKDITPLRIRWSPDGKTLLYCAEGRFWRVPAEGGQSQEIPFSSQLTYSREQPKLKSVMFPKPNQRMVAHGNMGLSISPDGEKIAAISQGRLWVWNVREKPVAVTDLPVTASGLCWSPDNNLVAWSAGTSGSENLFATDVQSGHTRCLTSLPGTEVRASWSPNGEYIAFVYRKTIEQIRQEMMTQAPDRGNIESLRIIKVSDAPVSELEKTLNLQTYRLYGQSLILSQGLYWGRPWSPDSKYILGEAEGKPVLLSLEGKVIRLNNSKELPQKAVLLWGKSDSLIYTDNFLLWKSNFDTLTGIKGEPVPVNQDAALYPSLANDGSLLYISDDGLRLRRANGKLENLGWPLSFVTTAAASPVLIRNVKIIDGTGAAISQSRDILIERGLISRIMPAGKIKATGNISIIDAEGRIAMPGMIDAHLHIWDQTLLPELLYEGITTAREMGSQMAWVKGFQESIETGLQDGPRIVLGGFIGTNTIRPSLMNTAQQIGNSYGVNGVIRALSLAKAFEFDFIKMYQPINSYSGAKFIQMAHEMGFPVSSHNGYPLPLVASGIDSKEHTNEMTPVTGPRLGGELQDDIIQLIKTSGMGIIPTISSKVGALSSYNGSFTKEGADSPFLCGWRAYGLLYPKMPEAFLMPYQKSVLQGRKNIARLQSAGIPIAAGTDLPMSWMPWSLHIELEEYVASGLSPLEAIKTASINAATILRAEKMIGSIEVGKLADIVILNANPLEDIRNTSEIWKVIQGGKVVDREALHNWINSQGEEVAVFAK